jgi:hypothetical protein
VPEQSHPPDLRVVVRWTIFGSLAAGAVGLLLPWASVAFLSVTGVDTGDGKVYGAVLIVGALAAT